ncbi:MAG: 50S ribosomal protein L4 [bacterium]
MKAEIVNVEGKKTGEIDLSESIFNCEIKQHLLHEVVHYQLAKRRSGTASTKNRSKVRGGGSKPYRQKGTGRARAGTSRSPLWVGGGIIFGPQPRDYSFKVNKKVRKQALCTALSLLRKDGNITVIDEFPLKEAKTRYAVEILEGLGVKEKALIIVNGEYEQLRRATRNLSWIKVMGVSDLNVFDILNYKKIIVLQSAMAKIEERLG